MFSSLTLKKRKIYLHVFSCVARPISLLNQTRHIQAQLIFPILRASFLISFREFLAVVLSRFLKWQGRISIENIPPITKHPARPLEKYERRRRRRLEKIDHIMMIFTISFPARLLLLLQGLTYSMAKHNTSFTRLRRGPLETGLR